MTSLAGPKAAPGAPAAARPSPLDAAPAAAAGSRGTGSSGAPERSADTSAPRSGFADLMRAQRLRQLGAARPSPADPGANAHGSQAGAAVVPSPAAPPATGTADDGAEATSTRARPGDADATSASARRDDATRGPRGRSGPARGGARAEVADSGDAAGGAGEAEPRRRAGDSDADVLDAKLALGGAAPSPMPTPAASTHGLLRDAAAAAGDGETPGIDAASRSAAIAGADGSARGRSAALEHALPADARGEDAAARTATQGRGSADARPDAGDPRTAIRREAGADGAAALASRGSDGGRIDAATERTGAPVGFAPRTEAGPGSSPASWSAVAAAAGLAAPGDRAGDAGQAAGTASSTIATPVDSPAFAGALGLQIGVLARDGVERAELSLHPAELGPVSVRIVLDGASARVDFGADAAAARQAIEGGLPQLAAALRDAGFTLAGGGVGSRDRHADDDRGADGGVARIGTGGRGGKDRARSTDPVPAPLGRARLGAVDLYA